LNYKNTFAILLILKNKTHIMNKIYMLIFAAGTFIFASCGGEEKKTEETTTTTTTTETAPAATETAPAATDSTAAQH